MTDEGWRLTPPTWAELTEEGCPRAGVHLGDHGRTVLSVRAEPASGGPLARVVRWACGESFIDGQPVGHAEVTFMAGQLPTFEVFPVD